MPPFALSRGPTFFGLSRSWSDFTEWLLSCFGVNLKPLYLLLYCCVLCSLGCRKLKLFYFASVFSFSKILVVGLLCFWSVAGLTWRHSKGRCWPIRSLRNGDHQSNGMLVTCIERKSRRPAGEMSEERGAAVSAARTQLNLTSKNALRCCTCSASRCSASTATRAPQHQLLTPILDSNVFVFFFCSQSNKTYNTYPPPLTLPLYKFPKTSPQRFPTFVLSTSFAFLHPSPIFCL